MAYAGISDEWKDLPIKELVLETDDFIVFVNDANMMDYKTSSAYDQRAAGVPKKHRHIMNEVAAIESIPHAFLCEGNVIGFKRLICEAVARSLEYDYENANSMLANARDFIKRRQSETSRKWYLAASTIFTVAVLAATAIFTVAEAHFFAKSGGLLLTPFVLVFASGCCGAFLSIAMRMGKTVFDHGAEAVLHYWEASIRVCSGGICAIVAMLAVKAGIIFSAWVTPANESMAMLFIAFVAGASERLIPGLIETTEATKAEMPGSSGVNRVAAKLKEKK